jgi:DNA-3-methyladenine glycosylase II
VSTVALTLAPVPPFRLDLTAWALRRRPQNVVDRWDGRTWRRALLIEGKVVDVAARLEGTSGRPRVRVEVTAPRLARDAPAAAARVVEEVLGLRVDLAPFYRIAEGDRHLAPLAERFRGLKPPRFPTLFEALANAVCCQQVSLASCMHLLARIVRAYGEHAEGDPDARAFPRPETLARIQPRSLQAMGASTAKARSLVAAARACAGAGLGADELATRRDEEVIAELDRLPGIGRWSAQYVLLRGLGRLNVFPSADAGGRRSLRRMFARSAPMDTEREERLVSRWHPWAGLVYFHFLLAGLEEQGMLA